MSPREYDMRTREVQDMLGMDNWMENPDRLIAHLPADILQYVVDTDSHPHKTFADRWVEGCKRELFERLVLLNQS